MAVQSGKLGFLKINGAQPADIKNWEADRSNEMKAYRSSSTNGETGRVAGNNDLTGTFEVYNTAAPVAVGTRVQLALYTSSGATPAVGYAIIGNFNTICNIETGDIIGFKTSWGEDASQGAWTGI